MVNSRWRAPQTFGVLAVLAILVLPGAITVASVGVPDPPVAAHPSAALEPGATVPSMSAIELSDDTSVLGGPNGTAPIVDAVVPGTVGLTVRSYTVEIRVPAPASGFPVLVDTDAVFDWASPSQLPGGPDALPPLSEWQWSVTAAGRTDTPNWTVDAATGDLQRTVDWQNATFVVVGQFVGAESVRVYPGIPDGTQPTSLSVSLNGWSPGAKSPTTANLTAATGALHPSIVRFGMTSSGIAATWNVTNGTPTFDLAHFDMIVGFIDSVGAVPMLSLPAGTWGDGNVLPAGMPENLGVPIELNGSNGFFADASAYATYVATLAAHVRAVGEALPYWEVGNEVPLLNVSEVGTFAQLITVAAAAIHSSLPNALVSADTITSRTYLDQFANTTTGVGFLSFHYYASNTLCTANGSYCPPGTMGEGDTDGDLMSPLSNITHAPFLPPATAQADWFALTGEHLPILDTESNLNAAGGTGPGGTGSDPRIPALFGAAWLGSTLIDASRANVSALTYFRLTNPGGPNVTETAPFGGFGFGLTTLNLSNQFVEFAPYWASYLWANHVQNGGNGVLVNATGAVDVAPYAVRSGNHLTVVLVNRMDTEVNTTVAFPNASEWSPTGLSVLDTRGYDEVYDAANQSVAVERSGVVNLTPPGSGGRVQLDGYGMAVLTGLYQPLNSSQGPGNSSNGTGSGNGTGPRNQTGTNTSANQTGANATNTSGSSSHPPTSGTHTRAGNSASEGASALPQTAVSASRAVLGLSTNRWAALLILGVTLAVALVAWGSSAPLPGVQHARPPPRRTRARRR
ncbi:MAG: hypothetical protein L3K00_00775 [Thermoplasmata archaeon]|nr:hypothetical protein [Thermoplasmata archaeon]